ncbi:hypothetical protein IE81DRAFT_307817 [Ceraceosorus guamensis]|uniref:Uncharacterized protein n=1 Tax=Ceraceosorus guamensis TaxID=1522189 RepID=A0A316W8Q5_9BASI|nr:hypothetical protein IE81DRAFT_307817 [Ceraceosorus guamensis]PWN46300.1 hypothetical protein IE81DRAFT_307817 [Ceraceosorus guamensis]
MSSSGSSRLAAAMGNSAGRTDFRTSASASPEKESRPGSSLSSQLNSRGANGLKNLDRYRYQGAEASKPVISSNGAHTGKRSSPINVGDSDDDGSVQFLRSQSKDVPPPAKKGRFKLGARPRADSASSSGSPQKAIPDTSTPEPNPRTQEVAQRVCNLMRTENVKVTQAEVYRLLVHYDNPAATLAALKEKGRKALEVLGNFEEDSVASLVSAAESVVSSSDRNAATSTAPSSLAPSPRSVEPPKRTTSFVSQSPQSTSSASRTFMLKSPAGTMNHRERDSENAQARASWSPKPASSTSKSKLQTYSKAGNAQSKRAISISDDGGSGDDGYSDAGDEARELNAFKYFADCTRDELLETTGCKPQEADIILSLRPFHSPSDVRRKLESTKGVRPALYDNCEELMASYHAVDSVISRCENTGKKLQKEMGSWDSNGGKNAPASYLRKQPEDLNDGVTLKDFQLRGVNWLNLLHRHRLGGILADEMGTGKTCQVIAFLTHELAQERKPRTHLIVVPSSVLENWQREFQQFAPHLEPFVYHGPQAERLGFRRELKEDKETSEETGEDREFPVVLTTYETVTSKQDFDFFRKFKFDIAVYDEGHVLKNRKSAKHQQLQRIGAEWRLLLTGTPLQNNLQELMSLLSFILPRYFEHAQSDLEGIFKTSANSQNLLSRERVDRAKTMLQPFVLRRRKADVLPELPTKTERAELVEMTDTQQKHWARLFKRTREQRLAAAAADAEDKGAADTKTAARGRRGGGAKKAEATKLDSSHVLMSLRKAANHPLMFREYYDQARIDKLAREWIKVHPDENIQHTREDFAENSDAELANSVVAAIPKLRGGPLDVPDSAWLDSGKIKAMERLIRAAQAKGERVIVFSQFVKMLDIICRALDIMTIKYTGFTGSTQVTERQSIVDEFTRNQDITVFLLSTGAGGVGINLTAANHVILYDSDFNPQNDRQASDRCYRIGQHRPVTVTRLISKGTIDEHILKLGAKKLRLADRVEGQEDDDKHLILDEGGSSPSAAQEQENAAADEEKNTNAIKDQLLKELYDKEAS